MATLSISIQDQYINEVIEALCQEHGWTDLVPNPDPIAAETTPYIPNPLTKAQFAQRVVKSFVKGVVLQYRLRVATDAVKVTINKEID